MTRSNKEVLMMRVGERPFSVAKGVPTDLHADPITRGTLEVILQRLLPREDQAALEEIGAVRHYVPPVGGLDGAMFTIFASAGLDGEWAQIRRGHATNPVRLAPRNVVAAPEFVERRKARDRRQAAMRTPPPHQGREPGIDTWAERSGSAAALRS